jgi:hypothetical protein
MTKATSDRTTAKQYDYSELMKAQCKQLGWCTDCSFDDLNPQPDITHTTTVFESEILVGYFIDSWEPVRVYAEEVPVAPMSPREAEEHALRLIKAASVAAQYQQQLDAMTGVHDTDKAVAL